MTSSLISPAAGLVAVENAPHRAGSFERVRQRVVSDCLPLLQQTSLPNATASRQAHSVAVQLLHQVTQAQKRLDRILELAASGKSFSSTELMSMQAQVYRSSQEIDVASKLVEKVVGGMKQVLQTQL